MRNLDFFHWRTRPALASTIPSRREDATGAGGREWPSLSGWAGRLREKLRLCWRRRQYRRIQKAIRTYSPEKHFLSADFHPVMGPATMRAALREIERNKWPFHADPACPWLRQRRPVLKLGEDKRAAFESSGGLLRPPRPEDLLAGDGGTAINGGSQANGGSVTNGGNGGNGTHHGKRLERSDAGRGADDETHRQEAVTHRRS